jgi:Nif-specific regulatory protein
MPTLLAIKGEHIGARFPLESRTTIGRGEENTIAISDSSVSRLHAEIVRRGRTFTIYDKESKNGVFVNSKQVKEHLLLKNDEIKIGSTIFLFDSDFDLKNARYSNKTIYISAPHDDTAKTELPTISPAQLIEYERTTLELLDQVADLFSPSSRPLPDALNTMMNQLLVTFNAQQGFIMLWDPILNELQPIVAAGEGEQIAASKSLINSAYHEKKALLSSDLDIDYRYASEPQTAAPGRSTLCAPLILEDEPIGLIQISKLGLDQYSLKDLRLLQTLARLVAISIEHSQNADKREAEPEKPESHGVIGESRQIQDVVSMIHKVARHSSSILFTGETGTGKELFARELHRLSPRRQYPFIAINCSAIPETLFESELFGYEKGAFTGASRLQRGKAEIAHGGTLFLDEIGDLSPAVQPKLLHFLQDKVFYRVGGTRPVQVDARIIAATNTDLEQAVREGRFREDLLFRLSIVKIHIPPLRERPSDIRLLVNHFIKKCAQEIQKPILGISDDAMIMLEKYSWPGNIRELENCIERAIILCEGKILKPQYLLLDSSLSTPYPAPLLSSTSQPNETARKEVLAKTPESIVPLREYERRYVQRALEQCHWNQQEAARLLQIHRNTLRKKIRDYRLKPPS